MYLFASVFKKIIVFIYFWLCWVFVAVASGSYSLVAEHRLLLVMAFLVGDHGLCVLGLQKLQHVGSIVMALQL